MESRKAWRNREPSAGEGVLGLLEGLRDGLGAQAVGLFDDDRADPSGEGSPPNFWDAFHDAACAEIDWHSWYGELRATERVEAICGCGDDHRLCGFLIHDRWALLVVAPPALHSDGAAAIASSLRALAERLPGAKKRDDAAEGTRAGGGPLWWVRKPPS